MDQRCCCCRTFSKTAGTARLAGFKEGTASRKMQQADTKPADTRCAGSRFQQARHHRRPCLPSAKPSSPGWLSGRRCGAIFIVTGSQSANVNRPAKLVSDHGRQRGPGPSRGPSSLNSPGSFMLYGMRWDAIRLCGIRMICVLSLGLVLHGCVSPATEFDNKAVLMGLERHAVLGKPFKHIVYRKPGRQTDTLHVYLGSDGTPWLNGWPAVDPTPRTPLALRLLALDPEPAVYVGRPCYHGATSVGPCSSRLWTTARYSEEVLLSLATAVRTLMEEQDARKVAWFGYSGGGTLAVLLASHFPETVSVTTVAASLDTSAWAVYLWGGDLAGSLNPAFGPPLPRHVRQRHYAGGKDRVVPPRVSAHAAGHLGDGLRVIADYDHVCCWERLWPEILRELATDPAGANARHPTD